MGYGRIEDLDEMIRRAGVVSAAIPRIALFLAGKAFRQYRSAGGVRTGVLPDFFLGAHAVVIRISADHAGRYAIQNVFPGIVLIAPN